MPIGLGLRVWGHASGFGIYCLGPRGLGFRA